MAARTSPTLARLGTILSVWAHPDDETYLAAGLMAAASDAGHRVVCASATAGELGTADPRTWPPERLGRTRRWEAAAAMAVLGVTDHRVLGLPDGGLVGHHGTGVAWAGRLIDEVRPDTIVTFGPDGRTFHPDHIAVHRWVTDAWSARGAGPRLLYAVTSREHVERFREHEASAAVYMTGDRPEGVPFEQLDLHVHLAGDRLDRKVVALRAMATQTGALLTRLGEETFAEMVADECFVAATVPAAVPDARGPLPHAAVPVTSG